MPATSPDEPLQHPEEDRLGYAIFARRLAEAVEASPPRKGQVIALYGRWGSGKTSTLNFVCHYLRDARRPTCVSEFNPWWYSGRTDLTRQFFAHLARSLGDEPGVVAVARDRIAAYGDLVAEAPVPYAEVGKVVAKLLRRDVPDLEGAKRGVVDALERFPGRLVLLIDDLDRLLPPEARDLLRLIKAVGDFPNVVYILAASRDELVSALAEVLNGNDQRAREYLEKIVQVDFDLPIPDKAGLLGLLTAALDEVFAPELEEDAFPQDHWIRIYRIGLSRLLRTPRDVIRLKNVLQLTYPPVRGEVSPVDFLALESLRLHRPEAYHVIRRNQAQFAPRVDHWRERKDQDDELARFHRAWLESVSDSDREWLSDYVAELFPRVGHALQRSTDYRDESSWRRELRIADPQILDTALRLAPPVEEPSALELKRIVSAACEPDDLSRLLIALAHERRADGTSRARAYLERLEDHTAEIPRECIEPFVKTLFDIGDQLLIPEDGRHGLFDWGNDIRLGRLTHQLLKRLPQQERDEIILGATRDGKSTAFPVHEIAVCGQEHGRNKDVGREPESDRTVSSDALDELQRLAVAKIRRLAETDDLLTLPDLPAVLFRWRDWDDPEAVREWVAAATSSDQGLVTFLTHFLGRNLRQGGRQIMPTVIHRLDPEVIRDFADPSAFEPRLRALLASGELVGDAEIAARQFLTEFDMRQEGRDPNAFDAFD